ncbi:MAG: hypothetical protein H7A53_13615 [Akkermansiaceae bacterium]|nr:hypothetical protein [Akkermansiaceae bacterium]MCP5551919.1 hypothetical protein [Akkermansiaceae bacterium]
MPVQPIDPIGVFQNATTSLVGRVLLFFAGGWVGLLVGRIAAAFDSWGDLFRPFEVSGRVFSGSFVTELLVMAFWPATTVVSAARVSVWLFFLAAGFLAVLAIVFLYTEEPAPAWWLAIVAVTSLIPPLAWEEPDAVSLAVLAFFWIGLGALGWWTLRIWHPELVESAAALLKGDKNRPEPEISPRRKAPKNAWGRPVEGVDAEAGDEDED